MDIEIPKHYNASQEEAFRAGAKAGEEQGFWTGYNEACKDFKIGEWAEQHAPSSSLQIGDFCPIHGDQLEGYLDIPVCSRCYEDAAQAGKGATDGESE